jgi:hypothetical protein
MRRKHKLKLQRKFSIIDRLLYRKVFNCNDSKLVLVDMVTACIKYRSEILKLYKLAKIQCDYEFTMEQPESLEGLYNELCYISDRFGCIHRIQLMLNTPEYYDNLNTMLEE